MTPWRTICVIRMSPTRNVSRPHPKERVRCWVLSCERSYQTSSECSVVMYVLSEWLSSSNNVFCEGLRLHQTVSWTVCCTMDELSSVSWLRMWPSSMQYPFWVDQSGIHCFTAIYPPLRLLMQKMDSHSVKDSLDTMLKKWKPKNFKPTKVEGIIPSRVCCSCCYMAVMNP